MTDSRRSLLLALLVAAIGVLFAFAARSLPELMAPGKDGPITNPTDFRAFYCAGAAIDAGRDPYRTEPMWSCQRDVLRANGLIIDDRDVLPAPLPPYALAVFALIARLRFPVASLLWVSLGLVTLLVTVVLVRRLSGLPLAVTALSLVAAEGWSSLILGQIVPFVVCALCVAALAVRSRRYVLAAFAATFAMIEPHVVLPALVALALCVPRLRLPLALGAAVLGVLSLVTVGPGVCIEYFAHVLSLHARSEVVNYGAQYSLSSLLWAAGVGKELAVKLGEASYAFVAVGGIVLARRLARRRSDDAFVALAPPAVALIGSPFMHIHQIAAALPFALMLWQHVPRRALARAAFAAAITSLAIPWQTVAELPFVADRLAGSGRVVAIVLPKPRADEIAEVPRTRYVEAFVVVHRWSLWEQTAWKLPTWFGLATMLAVAIRAARGNSRFQGAPLSTTAPPMVAFGSMRAN